MRIRLKPMLMAVVGAAIVAPTLLPAQDDATSEHTLGDHPAVIIFRTWTQPGYLSTTAVYPHPASITWYMRDPNAPDHSAPRAPSAGR